MYRPRRRGSARSTTSGACTAPWRHWPSANTTMAATRSNVAAPGVWLPANGTISQAAAHSAPSSPRTGIRRPCARRVVGNCARTMTIVLTKNTTPICVSVTLASFFAYTGRSSKPEKPAKMNRAFRPITVMKARWRTTSRYEPDRPLACAPPPSDGDGTRASITTA